MMTIAEQWVQQGLTQGLEQGRQEGLDSERQFAAAGAVGAKTLWGDGDRAEPGAAGAHCGVGGAGGTGRGGAGGTGRGVAGAVGAPGWRVRIGMSPLDRLRIRQYQINRLASRAILSSNEES